MATAGTKASGLLQETFEIPVAHPSVALPLELVVKCSLTLWCLGLRRDSGLLFWGDVKKLGAVDFCFGHGLRFYV